MPPPSSLLERAHREVIELHEFFVRWFSGDEPDAGIARMADALADDFHIVDPSTRIMDRAGAIAAVQAGRGSGETRIEIRAFEPRAVLGGNIALVSYEEWIERSGTLKPLLATAILTDAPGAPNNLRWRHVHETWLPRD